MAFLCKGCFFVKQRGKIEYNNNKIDFVGE